MKFNKDDSLDLNFNWIVNQAKKYKKNYENNRFKKDSYKEEID